MREHMSTQPFQSNTTWRNRVMISCVQILSSYLHAQLFLNIHDVKVHIHLLSLLKLIKVTPIRVVDLINPTRVEDKPTLSELITRLLCIKEHL
jgi:hypothetical protein